MKILSPSGKKEAEIVHTILNGITVRIFTITDNEKCLLKTKSGFKSYKAATKYSLKKVNG